MSVFAQPDSESEELLKWGGAGPFGVLQEVTIMIVSFHIRYRYSVTVQLCVSVCMCVFAVEQLRYAGHY